MPQRKAPSERLQRAAAAAAGVELQDEEDAPLRFSLRPGAPRWEAWLARVLQVRWSGQCRASQSVAKGAVGPCVNNSNMW